MESKMYEIREGNCQGNANCGKVFFCDFIAVCVGFDLKALFKWISGIVEGWLLRLGIEHCTNLCHIDIIERLVSGGNRTHFLTK